MASGQDSEGDFALLLKTQIIPLDIASIVSVDLLTAGPVFLCSGDTEKGTFFFEDWGKSSTL